MIRSAPRWVQIGTGLTVAALALAACTSSSGSSSESASTDALPSTAASAAPAASEGTAPDEGVASDTTIYVIGYENQSAFWKSEEAGANQAGIDFGVDVKFVAPQEASTQGMVTSARAALATNPYGILIDYIDDGMADVTMEALNQGVQVVLYNNNLFTDETPAEIKNLSYVGQDNTSVGLTSGDTLGRAFLEYVKAGDTVVVVNPFPQAYVLTLRYEGVKRGLEAGGVKVDLLVGEADEAKNQQIIGAYLQAHPEVKGVIGLGTTAANPAAQLMATATEKLPVATFDIDKPAFENIEAGLLNVAVYQAPFLQSYYGVQNLVNLNRWGFPPVNVNTGNTIITKDNLNLIQRLTEAGIS